MVKMDDADVKEGFADFALSLKKEDEGMAKRKVTASAPGFSSGDVPLQPMALVLYAVPGWGKTSTAAYATNPAILMAEKEQGYLTLLGAGRVPDVPRATVSGWRELMCQIEEVAEADDPPCNILALDVLGAFESYCHEYVCRSKFNGDWSKFIAYRKGYREAANTAWDELFSALDRVKANGVHVLMLSHHKVQKTRDPMTEEYAVSAPKVEKESADRVVEWADAVLFGTYSINTEDGKAEGGSQRLLYCKNHAAHVAKNRFGMPEMIRVPEDPSQNWQVIRDAIKEGTQNE